MAERKVKSRDDMTQSRKKDKELKNKKRKNLSSSSKNKKEKSNEKRRRRGPDLPNALRKELNLFNRDAGEEHSDGDEAIDFDDAMVNDVYEYEEGVPEEESKKNRRFDRVENYEFELPKDFEDWKVASDEGEDDDDDDKLQGDDDVDDDDNEDAGRHSRMLEQITGLPSYAFGGKKRKDVIISEAYPESEYNPSGDILDGDGRISVHDLLDPLHGTSGFSKLRKSLHRMEKKSVTTLTPLPKTDKERLERKAAYELSKKDITKWEPLVKRNREAPTLYFDEDVDVGYSTIGAIASEFEPRTDFEKKMASLVQQNEVVEAHKSDGARLLELNEVSVADVKERQARLAKMRSLLFRHEIKAKRIKNIKSKTYHRLLKKDKQKAAELSIQMDPEAAKEHAMKQEFKRAEERMTLKHKNKSKWAKRILERGLKVQDEGTIAAIGEQLNQHAALTRKMNSIKESSSSDDSSDGDDSDDMSANSDQDIAPKLIKKAKEKTLQVLEGDEELPKSGVLSLPFMVRGLKKKKEAADEEAKLALEEYESSLKQLGNKSASGSGDKDAPSGRRVFGVPKKVVTETRKKEKLNNYYGNSDSESDVEAMEDDVTQHDQTENSLREPEIDPCLLREEFGSGHDSEFKSFENSEDPEPKASYEVAYLASNSWKTVRRSSDAVKGTKEDSKVSKSKVSTGPTKHVEDSEQNNDEDSDTDSDGQMVDGTLSAAPKSDYELPSQAELIQRAFAGDDVEEDFEKDKEAVLDEENPEPEKTHLLPGWGQWTDVQKKKGLPSWMLKEHETAKKKRLESLKKRKDAHLNNVIISEKLDKKEMELVYGDSHVKASSSLSCRQMNDFLDLMKKTVGKIGVSRNSVKERTTDFCNGVCISSNGLILTHSFNKIDLVSICLHSPDNVEYSDVQIVKHDISSGLALLRPTQQKSYDHIRFGEETGFYVGQNLYAILYPKESTDPIILMGYVAYDCDPESKFITDVCPTRKTIKELDSDECAFPVGLGEDVPLLQIGHLGASDEFRQELGRYARKNFYGLAEGRGCPVFETTGNLVGVVVFQQSKYDFAIHIDEVKKFVSDALDPSTQYGGEKEKRKKKRKQKSKGPLSS